MIPSLTFMSRNFQHAALLPKTKHTQHNTEITTPTDCFEDGENVVRKLNASTQREEDRQWMSRTLTGGEVIRKKAVLCLSLNFSGPRWCSCWQHSFFLARLSLTPWTVRRRGLINLFLNSLMKPWLPSWHLPKKLFFVKYTHSTCLKVAFGKFGSARSMTGIIILCPHTQESVVSVLGMVSETKMLRWLNNRNTWTRFPTAFCQRWDVEHTV